MNDVRLTVDMTVDLVEECSITRVVICGIAPVYTFNTQTYIR